MKNPEKAIEIIFDSGSPFEEKCSAVFRFQIENNPVYRRFAETFGILSADRIAPDDITLLPIRAFRDAEIYIHTDQHKPEIIFKSSGTSGMNRSTHYILSKKVYAAAILNEFKKYFSFDEFRLLFYLPGYERNPQSSLIWMAKHLINSDPSGHSRFISFDDLLNIDPEESRKKKTLLFGAAFGLIDAIESGKVNSVKDLEILETGGMKTHRREITKTELRQALSEGFRVPLNKIHSEYGMCELLSQMYATGDEWFQTPHWVRVSIHDPKNPLRICEIGEEGKIGITDLANIYSCPFILTDDRGVMDSSGRFKVLGRWETDDMRGCNFLVDHE